MGKLVLLQQTAAKRAASKRKAKIMKPSKKSRSKLFHWTRLVSATLCLSFAGPCCAIDFNYIAPQAVGQIKMIINSVPAEKIMNDHGTNAAVKHKLMLIRQTQRFAKEVMGFKIGGSYTSYFDTGEEPVAWTVTATPKDSLEPVTWDFPIVGRVPYLGYFKKTDAERKKNELLAKGYDAKISAVAGYSLLGYLDDPILSSMMDESDEHLVEMIIHELAHANIYSAGKTDFNETTATFFGEEGAAQFFEKWLNRADARKNLQESREDEKIFSQMIQDTYFELKGLYKRQDISSLEKINKREEVFNGLRRKIKDASDQNVFHDNMAYSWMPYFPMDNAFILAHVRNHGGLEYIVRLHRSFEGDLKRTLEALRWSAKKDDPLGVIKEYTSLDEKKE